MTENNNNSNNDTETIDPENRTPEELAVLIDQLKGTFKWIKQHYEIINKICGILLIAVGIMMATGLFDRMIAFLA